MQHDGNRFFYVQGGHALEGEFVVHAAKNAVLPLMLAALLSEEEVVLENIPRLSDIVVMVEMLEHFGAKVTWHEDDLHIHAAHISSVQAPYALVSKMRASFVAMGALLGRMGRATISMPGGCSLGLRPVDRHISAFKAIGIAIEESEGEFLAYHSTSPEGVVEFEIPTVGGTQNIMLAAALGEGNVVIHNAAKEPEISDLANMLNAMGANIEGAGSGSIHIRGVKRLHGLRYRPIPDRLEAGTVMLAIAATRGKASLHNVNPNHLRALIAKLLAVGVRILEVDGNSLYIDASQEHLRAVDISAKEYPDFPTDLQAPFGAFLCTSKGSAKVRDDIYPERFAHVAELQRMGADLHKL